MGVYEEKELLLKSKVFKDEKVLKPVSLAKTAVEGENTWGMQGGIVK